MSKKAEELKEYSIEELKEMLGVDPEGVVFEVELEVDSLPPIEDTVLNPTTPKKKKEEKAVKDTLDFRMELTHKFHKLEAEKVLVKMKKIEDNMKLIPIHIPERKMIIHVSESKKDKIEEIKNKYLKE